MRHKNGAWTNYEWGSRKYGYAQLLCPHLQDELRRLEFLGINRNEVVGSRLRCELCGMTCCLEVRYDDAPWLWPKHMNQSEWLDMEACRLALPVNAQSGDWLDYSRYSKETGRVLQAL